jgi:acyl dehydratase
VTGRVEVGDQVPEWRLASVSPDHMAVMAAILRDPNPIHWDAAEVAKRGLGDRLINQGPINVAYICNALAAWAGPTALRSLTVRFTANVFAGDAVVAGGVVTEVEVDDEGDTTLVRCDVWLDRAGGERAVEGRAVISLPAEAG